MEDKNFISLSIDRFEQLRALGTKTLDQLGKEDIHWSPDSESNSIAIIVQHMYGNMLSRFTDLLTTDGEKPDRNRDQEFIEQRLTLEDLKNRWKAGWDRVCSEVQSLEPEDLDKTIFIRSEAHTVMEAIIRSLSHYAYHTGQIVYLGRMRCGSEWRTLSIPKGASAEYITQPFKQKNEV